MSSKVKINLYITPEIKILAAEKAKECNNTISNVFEQLIKSGKIIDYSSVGIGGIIKIFSALNDIEQHLYQIRKSIFEKLETGADIETSILDMKNFIDTWHSKIHEQIVQIDEIITEFNKIKQGII